MTNNADRLEERLSETFSNAPVPGSDRDLDPLLAMVNRLHQIGAIGPSAAAVQRTRLALLRASVPEVRHARAWWPKLATAVPLAIVLMTVGTVTTFAAPSALPDSPLYAVRNLRETIEIQLAGTPARRAELDVAFAQQRTDQLVRLTHANGGSPMAVSTLLRDISSRVHAADAAAREDGAAARAALQQAERQIDTDLTQLHDSGTLSPDASQQLDNTIHDVQSGESTNAPEPTPAPTAGNAPEATSTPEPTPSAEATQ
jgi:HPt (histidine-containing phosphotransfer) domain-containing protein